MSHFAFLQLEWPEIHEAATRAEAAPCPIRARPAFTRGAAWS